MPGVVRTLAATPGCAAFTAHFAINAAWVSPASRRWVSGTHAPIKSLPLGRFFSACCHSAPIATPLLAFSASACVDCMARCAVRALLRAESDAYLNHLAERSTALAGHYAWGMQGSTWPQLHAPLWHNAHSFCICRAADWRDRQHHWVINLQGSADVCTPLASPTGSW